MNVQKLSKISLALGLAGFTVTTLADTTFSIVWTGESNAASATGTASFSDTSFLTTARPIGGATNQFSSLTAFSITITGASAGNGTFDLTNVAIAPIWTSFPLDLNSNLIGQTDGTYVFGPTMGTTGVTNGSGDFNIFASGGGSCANHAPVGYSPFRILTDCMNGDMLAITSITLGSGLTPLTMVPNAYGLRSIYNSEHAVISQGLENDCDQFNDKGICIAAGGRYGRTSSTANVENNEATSSTLVAGYKYRPNVRLGGWIDAGLGNNTVNGVTLNSGKPLFGFYGVWSQHTDGTGYQVKASMAYGDKDLDVQRTSNNFGGAGLNEQAFSVIVSRELPTKYGVNVTPYGGVKYTRLNRGSYTEQGSGGLTYDALTDEQTSAVLGVKAAKKLNEKTTAFAGLGIEQKLNRNVGTYSAGSYSTAVFTDNPHATQATLTAGMVYQIDKKSRIDANVMMKQDPYMNTNSTAAMVMYKVGL